MFLPMSPIQNRYDHRLTLSRDQAGRGASPQSLSQAQPRSPGLFLGQYLQLVVSAPAGAVFSIRSRTQGSTICG